MKGVRSLEKCQSVRQLLANGKRWTTGYMAKSNTGQGVPATSKKAAAFCLVGAVRRVYKGDERKTVIARLHSIIVKKFPKFKRDTKVDTIINFNDEGNDFNIVKSVLIAAKV